MLELSREIVIKGYPEQERDDPPPPVVVAVADDSAQTGDCEVEGGHKQHEFNRTAERMILKRTAGLLANSEGVICHVVWIDGHYISITITSQNHTPHRAPCLGLWLSFDHVV